MVRSTPRPHFNPGKDPVPILQEAGWAPGPVWKDGKSRPHRDSFPDRPARSQSLYRLSYPAHFSLLIFSHLNYHVFRLSEQTWCVKYKRTVWIRWENDRCCWVDVASYWGGLRFKYGFFFFVIFLSLSIQIPRYESESGNYFETNTTQNFTYILYGSENWALTTSQRRRLETAEMKLPRPLVGYTLYDHKTNDYIRRELFLWFS